MGHALSMGCNPIVVHEVAPTGFAVFASYKGGCGGRGYSGRGCLGVRPSNALSGSYGRRNRCLPFTEAPVQACSKLFAIVYWLEDDGRVVTK